jgi:hypothetical protein
MNKERLEQALRVVKEVHADPKRRLELSAWVSEQGCGTVACVVGHCMQDNWFRDQGLTANRARANSSPVYITKAFEVYAGWDAVEQFFDLKYKQATYLFDEMKYVGIHADRVPLEIIARLTNAIKHSYVPGADHE